MSDLPTKPGPYYWREKDGDGWEPVIVIHHNDPFMEPTVKFVLNDFENDLKAMEGQWLPIPNAEELMELQACKIELQNIVKANAKEWGMPNDEFMHEFKAWAVNRAKHVLGMHTPREKLIENIVDIVHATHGTPNDETMVHFERLLVATLKTHYAIGRWVSVEERLPPCEKGLVFVRYTNGSTVFTVYNYIVQEWDYAIRGESVAHWLDLSMPEVEG